LFGEILVENRVLGNILHVIPTSRQVLKLAHAGPKKPHTSPLIRLAGAKKNPASGLFLFTFLGHNHAYQDMKAGIWIKRLGFWGFLFFLVKGLLWLIVPGLLAFWAAN
jgi:hypothetical protein